MSTQAISTASLICAGQSQRMTALRERPVATPAAHGTEFLDGMLEPGHRPLAKGEMLVLPTLDATLVVLEGEIWLTRDGDPEDHILGAGSCRHLGRRDQAMAQALRPSRVRLIGA